jgi:hypothetical protein
LKLRDAPLAQADRFASFASSRPSRETDPVEDGFQRPRA